MSLFFPTFHQTVVAFYTFFFFKLPFSLNLTIGRDRMLLRFLDLQRLLKHDLTAKIVNGCVKRMCFCDNVK